MKEKTKKLLEDLRRILLLKDGINYSEDTIIQTALTREIERIKAK
jgi:hypothetical protein